MSFLSDFSAAGGAHLGVQVVSGLFGGAVNLSRQEGVVKTLAEPTLLALSGQEANFLAGGKVFIPITQASPQGSVLTSLEEKEFGIALKFTPTVLKHGVIHLKVAPEVSEINTQGLSLNLSGSATATVLPMFTSRRATTTVELKEGDSLVIGGLVQHNHQSTLQRFPWLGDLPVLGVLFRSAQFQRDDTELVFIVTPRRVLRSPTALPTDRFREPLHDEFFLEGRSGSEASVETKEVPRGDLPAEAFPYEGATLTPAYRRLLETTQTPSAPALKAPGAPGFQP
jgi:pilus assembly protein CpaC